MIQVIEFGDPQYSHNPPTRCYFCKAKPSIARLQVSPDEMNQLPTHELAIRGKLQTIGFNDRITTDG